MLMLLSAAVKYCIVSIILLCVIRMGCHMSTLSDKPITAPQSISAITRMTKMLTETTVKAQSRAKNVFAKPLVAKEEYKPPVFAKTPEETQFLRKALPNNFVFEALSTNELHLLVGAMEKVTTDESGVIIQQGEAGDYFYVMFSGSANYSIDNATVGTATAGDSFGELSLLYTTPRAATVTATSKTVLFRVDQEVFRFILQQETLNEATKRIDLLHKVTFLKELDEYSIHKLAAVMTRVTYAKGSVILRKGNAAANHFYILETGTVACTEVAVGDALYQDVMLSKSGDYFGERALITGEPRAATVSAATEVVCHTIDRKTFDAVLGGYERVIAKANDKRQLAAIKLISDSNLNEASLTAASHLVADKTFTAGTVICETGSQTTAALYLVRSGTVQLTSDGNETHLVGPGGYFGEDQLKADIGKHCDYKLGDSVSTVAAYTATAGAQDVVCGVLTVAALRNVFDTRRFGEVSSVLPTARDCMKDNTTVTLASLSKHKILGEGTFGQVWLVSRKTEDGEHHAYALKVQSKYELCRDHQVKALINEKNIMAKLNHPFLIRQFDTFHDNQFVYFLLQLVQGGELYNCIHSTEADRLPENHAQFYAACVAEGLGFMHRQGFVYRDLKPENVMINEKGYCVIIDFGFAKYLPLPTKTFTLCGTPLYLAPEVILNRGHNGGADHWSLGILIFEMLTGSTPFYKRGMEQMDLFRSIVKGKIQVPARMSKDAVSIIGAFLCRNPAQRLGSLAGGEDDICDHKWFSDSIDFDELRLLNLDAPKVPVIADSLDASNFENWSHLKDKTMKEYPRLDKKDLELFDGFST